MPDTTTAAPPEPLGLDDVTEADIRRTLRGTLGSNISMHRKRTREAMAAELARLEAEAGRLRAWMRRAERNARDLEPNQGEFFDETPCVHLI